jgi:MipA family protein
MKRFIELVFAVVFFLGIISSAQAVDSPFVIDNIPNVVGAGGGMAPDYWGSDDYKGSAAPFFRYTFEGQERFVQFLVTELSLNILDHPNFTLGPVLNYRFGRDDSVNDSVVKKMEEIDDTVEAGIFAGYIWRDNTNPRHRFITNLEFLHDVGDKYNGWAGLAGARYWYPISRPMDVQIGVGATYGNSQYMDTYFGVSGSDATRTGLNRFEADSGIRDVNAQLAAVFHLSMDWHIGVGVKYFNLISDAADSPIVDKRGDANQWVYGIGLAYSWL